jgi:hypothetical protein
LFKICIWFLCFVRYHKTVVFVQDIWFLFFVRSHKTVVFVQDTWFLCFVRSNKVVVFVQDIWFLFFVRSHKTVVFVQDIWFLCFVYGPHNIKSSHTKCDVLSLESFGILVLTAVRTSDLACQAARSAYCIPISLIDKARGVQILDAM